MSKKDEAFILFSEGKRPSDEEVKALGLSTRTRYNYHQEFKKSQTDDGVAVAVDEVRELKQERAKLFLISQIEELEAKREKLPERVAKLERQVGEMSKWMDENIFIINKNLSFLNGCVVALAQGRALDKVLWDNLAKEAETEAIKLDMSGKKYTDRIKDV